MLTENITRKHYAWLDNFDKNKKVVYSVEKYNLTKILTLYRWRIFYCLRRIGFRKGEEWFVTHYLLER